MVCVMHTRDMDTEIDIKAIREKCGWNQLQLAEYLGVDRSSVSRMENGQKPSGSVRRLLQGLISNPPLPDPETQAAAE